MVVARFTGSSLVGPVRPLYSSWRAVRRPSRMVRRTAATEQAPDSAVSSRQQGPQQGRPNIQPYSGKHLAEDIDIQQVSIGGLLFAMEHTLLEHGTEASKQKALARLKDLQHAIHEAKLEHLKVKTAVIKAAPTTAQQTVDEVPAKDVADRIVHDSAATKTPTSPVNTITQKIAQFLPQIQKPPAPTVETAPPQAAAAQGVETAPAPPAVAPKPAVSTRRPPPEKLEGIGNGREILLQAYNWESCKEQWYVKLEREAADLAGLGITGVMLPPMTDSVSPQGYMPRDLYNLNSKYGSEAQLRSCIKAFQKHGVLVIGDVILNHRCASHQGPGGVWNQFGGKLAWDSSAICSNDPNYQGRGHHKHEEMFDAAPNLDHRQPYVREGLKEWLRWLRDDIGYDGWRLDYVRGLQGAVMQEYMEASRPHVAVGEFWDDMEYAEHNVPCWSQQRHRQRVVNWINSASNVVAAFDTTTKGILHAVLERCEYRRLVDPSNKPAGVLGMWPSRAVTFLENHDTGSTQRHWCFPEHGLQQGYAYILTHCGTPTVFYDHLDKRELRECIRRLVAIRQRNGLTARSHVEIQDKHMRRDRYVAMVDKKVLVQLGPNGFNPDPQDGWVRAASGDKWCVWERAAA